MTVPLTAAHPADAFMGRDDRVSVKRNVTGGGDDENHGGLTTIYIDNILSI